MKDLKLKIKRQTEILGLVISSPSKYQIGELAELYNVDDLTIKRDLQDLRSLGIDIHSNRKKGISIYNSISNESLKTIIHQYISIAINHNTFDQATNLFINKVGTNAIAILTQLQIFAENNFQVKIKYLKPEEKVTEERIIDPYIIFQADKNWRLLANHNGTIKQFLLNNIKSIEKLDKKFKPISFDEIEEIFRTSFKCWLGKEKINVKLKFLPPWTDRLKPRKLMELEKVTENPDGSIIYETIVNSTNEIASWIVSRGKGVVVLEPIELKDLVIKLANEVLENYK
ncbi:helix-turn-helix transcriptional regulator [Stygiobacter electus]|uniref:Transcriptional regulator n=1 Tax=Stygiobacter electus TaxID=3032292 RepID=A0AAE3NWP8_9BACT|nr:transcriptional regulator [Stygiobacter electus]MDF1612356.1 transcriptional regulator [Stygiobacter electus]